jgi:ubiquinone/menaquinone biosynthesis C-methylase UbiE
LSAEAVKAIRSYWDRKAHIYAEVRVRREWFQETDKRVLELIDAQSCSVVLDVGTGPGSFAVKLAKNNNAFVVGIDISKRFLRIAKTHIAEENASNNVHLITASADFLPFRGDSFDAVTSIFTIHHLPSPRMENSFKEFYRVLKPRGKFALVEDWASEPRSSFQHVMYELRRSLMRDETEEYHVPYHRYVMMIEKSGLKVFDVEFHPKQVDLSRFEGLSGARARRLLEEVEATEQRQQVIDTTYIGATKPKQYRV